MKHPRSPIIILSTPRPPLVMSRDELRREYIGVLIELARMSGKPSLLDHIERLLDLVDQPEPAPGADRG